MKKLECRDKINIYKKAKEGRSFTYLSKKYGVDLDTVKYLVKLIDKNGVNIIKKKIKKAYYSRQFKEDAVLRVLINNESIREVSIDLGLTSHGMLSNWISNYKENGYNVVERKRGRPTMPKVTKKKENETKDEKIKRLEEENLYLKAELEYRKKLNAVVQARKNRQQKKK